MVERVGGRDRVGVISGIVRGAVRARAGRGRGRGRPVAAPRRLRGYVAPRVAGHGSLAVLRSAHPSARRGRDSHRGRAGDGGEAAFGINYNLVSSLNNQFA